MVGALKCQATQSGWDVAEKCQPPKLGCRNKHLLLEGGSRDKDTDSLSRSLLAAKSGGS